MLLEAEFITVTFPIAYEGNPIHFLRGCVAEICSAGMWPTKRGEGESPSHLSCISLLIQQQPLNLIFQHFLPLSALFCLQLWNVLLESIVNCKNLISVTCFPSFYFFFCPHPELIQDRFGLLLHKKSGLQFGQTQIKCKKKNVIFWMQLKEI